MRSRRIEGNTDARHCHLLIESHSSIADIPTAELVPLMSDRTVYVTRPWLHGIELMRAEKVEYLTCRTSEGQLVGVLPIYRGDVVACGFYDLFGHFLGRSGDAFRSEDWRPCCLVGTREGFDNEFLVHRNAPAPEGEILRRMLEHAWMDCLEMGIPAMAAMYLNPTGTKQLRDANMGFESFFGGADVTVRCDFASFDEYIDSLGSRGRQVRKERRVFAKAGYIIDHGTLASHYDIVAALSLEVERKYGADVSLEAEVSRLRRLALGADSLTRVFLLRLGEKVVGCLLALSANEKLYARTVGLAYEKLVGAKEYFNLNMYLLIEFAIENGFEQVHLGMATYEAKLNRGGRAIPHFNSVLAGHGRILGHDAIFRDWVESRMSAVSSGDGRLMDELCIP
ncbi:GNAT family N-acetyltransferase [Nocardia gipuzkoensis]